MERKKRIAIVGPESSGKTDLCKSLAQEFNEPWVEEMARSYLEPKNGIYDQNDLLEIAKLQLEKEQELFSQAKQFLFCDTNLLVIKIWSEWKFNNVDPKISGLWNPNDYDLHLLCKPDLPYEDDPLRENPETEDRLALFEIYRQELENEKVPFHIISGQGELRSKKAKEIIASHFSL